MDFEVFKLRGIISTVNSSITPINSSQSFTGEWENVENVSSVTVFIKTDQLGTCYFESSMDGTNLDNSIPHPLTNAINYTLTFVISPRLKYFRIKFTNTSLTNQTVFRLQSSLATSSKGAVYIPINEALNDNSVGQNVRSVVSGKRDDGTYGNCKLTNDNQLLVTNQTYYQSIAENYVTNHSPFTKNGYNPALSSSSEDMWAVGGVYVPPATQIQMRVVSSSVNDTAAGTGVQSVTIYYLDNTFAEKTVDVTLNGTTPVNTSVSNIYRVNYFIAKTVGTGGSAAGNISLQDTTGAINYSYIQAGQNIDRVCFYTVPLGKSLFIFNILFSTASNVANRPVTITSRATYDRIAGVSRNFFIGYTEATLADGAVDIPIEIPTKLPAGTDLKVSAISPDGATYGSVVLRGWIENNN